jgi:hypothetical protein
MSAPTQRHVPRFAARISLQRLALVTVLVGLAIMGCSDRESATV